MERYTLLVDSHHGVYIPREFVQGHNMEQWNVEPHYAFILSAGIDFPSKVEEMLKDKENNMHVYADHSTLIEEFGKDYLDNWSEIYWETWDSVFNTAYYECEDGHFGLYLGECGDVFAERIMEESELAEYLAEQNELDVEVFKAFIYDSAYSLGNEWEEGVAIKDFKESYYGTYASEVEFARENTCEQHHVPAHLIQHINWSDVFYLELNTKFYFIELPAGNVAIFSNNQRGN